MELDEIKALIDLMDEAGLSEIEIEDSGRRVALKKASAAPTVSAVPAVMPAIAAGAPAVAAETEKKETSTTKQHQITSPIVGTFYTAASPNTGPYVELNDLVKKGQTLCIVEAMKLMNEIESDINGRIVEICVDDGTAVEYGEPLFTIEPA
ncbi:MAG: acetyl-CoA carboxylase biotin carboxyl carrier protein [Nitrospiria bacterium]